MRSDPSVLSQWKFGKLSYDVSQAQAKDASAFVVVPLSAAAPRMRYLQDRLLRDRTLNDQPLPAPVRVRLAAAPDEGLAVIRTAMGEGGKVEVWREGVGTLRRFIPAAEGGADQSAAKGHLTPQIRFQLNTSSSSDFPAILKHDELGFDLQRRLSLLFAFPFLRAVFDPDSPRELSLRGALVPAVHALVQEQADLQRSQNQMRLRQPAELEQEVVRWIREVARPAYANLIRSRGTEDEAAATAATEQIWRWKSGEPIEVLINGTLAGPRGAEVLYQLALIKFEQATRDRRRVELAATVGLTLTTDAAHAHANYLDADLYWREYLDKYPTRPGLASAQSLRAETLARLGRKDEAVKLWKDLSAPQTDLERLGRTWEASRVEGPDRR